MKRDDWKGAMKELLTLARFGLGDEWDAWEPRYVARFEGDALDLDARRPASARAALSPDLVVELDARTVEDLLAKRYLDVLFRASMRGRLSYVELLKKGLSAHAKTRPVLRSAATPPAERRRIARELSTRLRARHAPSDIARIEEVLRMWSGEVDVHPAQDQLVEAILPGTTPTPWLDPTRFTFSEDAKRASGTFREESRPIAEGALTLPAYNDDEAPWGTGNVLPWGRGTLYRHDLGFTPAADRFPTITAHVRQAASTGRLLHAAFLTLEPGVTLQRHADATLFVASFHLGLHIPPTCELEVAGEARTHHPGEILIFDDSFLHRAWNRSDRRRVVLSAFLLTPDLADHEIAPLTLALQHPNLWGG